MAEGIGNVRTKFIKFDLGKDPYQAGLIMCVTPDDLHPSSTIHNISFLSRLIPFSYEFTDDEKEDILDFVFTQEEKFKELCKIASKSRLEIEIPLEFKPLLKEKAKKLARIMNEYCGKWEEFEVKVEVKNEKGEVKTETQTKRRKIIKNKLFGTRASKYYLTYLKAIALKNHPERLIIEKNDYIEFEQLEQYFNFSLNALPETPQKLQISESKTVSEPKKHFWTRKPKEKLPKQEQSLTYG
jgi:hypothetical protein